MTRHPLDFPMLIFAALGIIWLAAGIWIAGSDLHEFKPLFLTISCLTTITLPIIVGIAYDFRYRLWHCFAWIALIAAQLAYYVQG
jgi:hypothetical protein